MLVWKGTIREAKLHRDLPLSCDRCKSSVTAVRDVKWKIAGFGATDRNIIRAVLAPKPYGDPDGALSLFPCLCPALSLLPAPCPERQTNTTDASRAACPRGIALCRTVK